MRTYGPKRLIALSLGGLLPIAALALGGCTEPASAATSTTTAAVVDLAATVRTIDPYAVGVVSSTYGANPLSSTAQAAAEERLDARYIRIPVGYRNGRVTSSAAGGPTTLDVPALVRWYRSKGFKVIAVIGGRTNDVDVQPGDATRIVQALGTDGVVYSTPNEPTNQGWTLTRQLQAADMIEAEGRAVAPGFTLWGPTWAYYDRTTMKTYAQHMGTAGFGGVDYHHYAMGSTSISTAQAMSETPKYGQEVRDVRSDLAGLGLPQRVSVDELNFSWRYHDGTAPNGDNTRFFTAVNTVWTASALGHVLTNGGSGAVYATQNGPLGVTVQAGANDQGRPASSPMPSYWGIGAWTGAKTFPHFKDKVLSVTGATNPSVETFAVNNEAGGYDIVLVNKSESVDADHVLTVKGLASGTYDAYQSTPSAPYDAPRKVLTGKAFAGTTTVHLPAMTVTTLVVHPATITTPPSTSTVVARIDAGGATSGWASDSAFVTGGASGTNAGTVANLPAGVPQEVFSAERWGNQRWRIPVPAAGQYDVHLYFAEKYAGVTAAGQRTFSVRLNDSVTVEPALDVYARAGGRNLAITVSATVTSQSYVTIDLQGVVGSAFVDGIEVDKH